MGSTPSHPCEYPCTVLTHDAEPDLGLEGRIASARRHLTLEERVVLQCHLVHEQVVLPCRQKVLASVQVVLTGTGNVLTVSVSKDNTR